MLTRDEVVDLLLRLRERTRPERVILFGSYAKGTATARSDIDVLVVERTFLRPEQRGVSARALLNTCLVPVDLHVYTPEEFDELAAEVGSFVHTVVRTGVEIEIPSDRSVGLGRTPDRTR